MNADSPEPRIADPVVARWVDCVHWQNLGLTTAAAVFLANLEWPA